jgi:hypothetical protein
VNERLPQVSAQKKLRIHHRLPWRFSDEYRHTVAKGT